MKCSGILLKKHLGIFVDSQLTFVEHLKLTTTKVNETMGLLWMLQKIYQDQY